MAYSRERNAVFEQVRNRLFAVAYRMMGTKADAEDIVQEAYLRWHQADIDEVRSPEAWLVSVVTRLSIDRLRRTSVERGKYIGPWLPEPLFGNAARSPEEELELASDLSLAFMVVLERLAPVERAAFLLHDVFDCPIPRSLAFCERAKPPAGRWCTEQENACAVNASDFASTKENGAS